MTTVLTSSDRTEMLNDLLAPVLPVAYRVAVNFTRDPHEAEDVVQEAALNACRGFDSFERGTNFKAWFLRIVTNAFISRYRRRSRSGTTVSIDDLDRPEELDLMVDAISLARSARARAHREDARADSMESERTGGAAEVLNLKPTTLEARMKKLGIVRP
jgi:RNA polymerase sigma factor (sigma-70 family)